MVPLGLVSLGLSLVLFQDLDAALTDPAFLEASPDQILSLFIDALLPSLFVGFLNIIGLWLIRGVLPRGGPPCVDLGDGVGAGTLDEP